MSRDEALTEMIRIEEEVNRDYYAGMTRGRIEERERIIKLIEEECAGDWPKVIEMSLANLIALIKGEAEK